MGDLPDSIDIGDANLRYRLGDGLVTTLNREHIQEVFLGVFDEGVVVGNHYTPSVARKIAAEILNLADSADKHAGLDNG